MAVEKGTLQVGLLSRRSTIRILLFATIVVLLSITFVFASTCALMGTGEILDNDHVILGFIPRAPSSVFPKVGNGSSQSRAEMPPRIDKSSSTPYPWTKTISTEIAGSRVEIPRAPTVQRNLSTPSFVKHSVCTGCYLADSGNHQRPCGKILASQRAKKSYSMIEAGRELARANEMCGRCDPSSCLEHEKRYWRPDDVAPQIEYAQTHFLKSIPETNRVPADRLQNLSEYFSEMEDGKRVFLFEFNPSIVKLPESQRPSIEVSGSSASKQPVYLAAYRISNMHACIVEPETLEVMASKILPKKKPRQYLGLAFLDSNLNIVQETMLDVRVTMPHFEDPRLFILHDQIFIGSYSNLVQIYVVPPNGSGEDILRVPAMMGESNMTLYVRNRIFCSRDDEARRLGKNLVYFVDSDNRTMIELMSMGDKEMLDAAVDCSAPFRNKTLPHYVQTNVAALPLPSFATMDELHYVKHGVYAPALTFQRGSACCVAMENPDPDGPPLLLGISHSKSRYKQRGLPDANVPFNSYFSAFYAMEAKAPYRVVARTGNFCFGRSAPDEAGGNPYANLNQENLWIGNTQNCPRIHFVSGMVEKADDDSKLIVSYGVNDCAPRLVVIAKDDVQKMLFAPSELEAKY
jgi:ribosomal protein S27AE